MSKNLSFLDQFEIGGSFFELIEFSLMRRLPDGRIMRGIYGVNVAKVREVVHMPRINPLASSISGVAGIFELRGVPIPAVNLCHILGDANAEITQDQQIIVTEFSQKRAGFIVSTTHRIRRISWEKVLPPSSDTGSSMSGMILIEDNEFLFILDLEKIIADIESQDKRADWFPGTHNNSPYQSSATENLTPPLDPHAPGILLVDDSQLIRTNVGKFLSKHGYRVLLAENGEVALNKLLEIATGQSKFGTIDCVVTDVEMPRMNGLTLITKIRASEELKNLPIFLHTSQSGTATQNQAKEAGANGYIVKNDLNCIVELVKDISPGSNNSIGV